MTEKNEQTHDEYVEEKLEGTEKKIEAILVLLGIIALELFLLLIAITRAWPGVWRF